MASVYPNSNGKINSRDKSDSYFAKIGGLANHIQVLREMIIIPLLYGDMYHHFSIKAPRGVIFYGPPGTGKTLVAGALASELNKESNGKVSFYHRKGADVLDKWVGESEKNLRILFDKARRTRPSVIFFDEIDGLAPHRSSRNDQVHSSIVTTLLALMDGLDNTPGVVVIGATNRIDSLDPALRRPGRFDKELYFPLPDVTARNEILQVHTSSWRYRPSDEFLRTLGEMTSGCCGSDLQALCAEAVLCCLKRNYPLIHKKPKMEIELKSLLVEEQDFLTARTNVAPSTQRMCTTKMRRLSPFIKPLVQKQIQNILNHLQVLLPQFTRNCKTFLVGNERYAGRLILKGSTHQGLHSHILPALLQSLEHMQCFILDSPAYLEKIVSSAMLSLPSILVLSRIEDWWDTMENNLQACFISALEDLHAGLPILLIVTCSAELPQSLYDHFYYRSTIVIQIKDPTEEEREGFFAPLFFGTNALSVYSLWANQNSVKVKTEKKSGKESILSSKFKVPCRSDRLVKGLRAKHIERQKKISTCNLHKVATGRVTKRCDADGHLTLFKIQECCKNAYNRLQKFGSREIEQATGDNSKTKEQNRPPNRDHGHLLTAVTELVDCRRIGTNAPRISCCSNNAIPFIKQEPIEPTSSLPGKKECKKCSPHVSADYGREEIYNLWKRTSCVVSSGLKVVQLELLYDTISACIHVNQHSFQSVISGLKHTLKNFEATCQSQNNNDDN